MQEQPSIDSIASTTEETNLSRLGIAASAEVYCYMMIAYQMEPTIRNKKSVEQEIMDRYNIKPAYEE